MKKASKSKAKPKAKPKTQIVSPLAPLTVKQPPAWTGPENEGISYSSLNRFLECRERFRIYSILGIREEEDYSDALTFGSVWHAAEEVLSSNAKKNGTGNSQDFLISKCLAAARQVAEDIKEEHPSNDYEIDCAYRRVKVIFPLYMAYWQEHKDNSTRIPVYQEEEFKVHYKLPFSGRTIILKGIFDAVDIIDGKVYLQENKTKGRIDSQGITATLSQNLQTMMYIIALQHLPKTPGMLVFPARVKTPIGGVRYNIVHNSGHKVGGSRTTEKDYMERVQGDPNKFFHRWRVELYKQDIEDFRTRVFDPIMEQLVQWYDWVASGEGLANPFDNPVHWQAPWGTYNSLSAGWRGSYFELLTHNSTSGLYTVKPRKPKQRK